MDAEKLHFAKIHFPDDSLSKYKTYVIESDQSTDENTKYIDMIVGYVEVVWQGFHKTTGNYYSHKFGRSVSEETLRGILVGLNSRAASTERSYFTYEPCWSDLESGKIAFKMQRRNI